jgi:hypothetical protein
MTPMDAPSPQRKPCPALLPWLMHIAAHQWRASKKARRAVHAEARTWELVLEDAQRLAAQSRAMAQVARPD